MRDLNTKLKGTTAFLSTSILTTPMSGDYARSLAKKQDQSSSKWPWMLSLSSVASKLRTKTVKKTSHLKKGRMISSALTIAPQYMSLTNSTTFWSSNILRSQARKCGSNVDARMSSLVQDMQETRTHLKRVALSLSWIHINDTQL